MLKTGVVFFRVRAIDLNKHSRITGKNAIRDFFVERMRSGVIWIGLSLPAIQCIAENRNRTGKPLAEAC